MIIKNLIIIAGILTMAFLSQQPWVAGTTQTYLYPGIKKSGDYINNSFLGKTGEWIGSKFTSEVEKRGEVAKEELSDQKDAAVNSGISSTKKFIAEKTLQMLGVKAEDLAPECKP